MIIKQIPVGYLDNFCDIVGCKKTRKALVIDPGSDTERILSEADAENLEIITIVNTHGHGDHTAGNAALKKRTRARVVIHELDGDRYPEADVLLSNEKTLQLGDLTFDFVDDREKVWSLLKEMVSLYEGQTGWALLPEAEVSCHGVIGSARRDLCGRPSSRHSYCGQFPLPAPQ